jgi:uncharacterized membrane protein YGL010W
MKKERTVVNKIEPKRQIDKLFEQYAEYHPNVNNVIQWICVPLIVFSLLGLAWAIPFPHLDFLGRYNGYLNWASFLIAFSVYFYYKLSPVMSYLMLILIFVVSMGVVQLEQWQLAGGPALGLVCGLIFVLSWLVQFIARGKSGKAGALTELKFLFVGPIWLLHLVCKKVGLKY